jgi:acyl-CoA reductase-like NAD-dependent aldehyde dehydrogenase
MVSILIPVVDSDSFVIANKNLTLNAVAGAAFGAAGQRCMALSVGACIYRDLQPVR